MTTTTADGYAVCEVVGCYARVHGQGRCRVHYDEARYLASTGRSPEAEEARRREWAERDLLAFGWRSDRFSEDDAREVWERRRDEIMAEYLHPDRPHVPGRRPAAWWHFEAGRDEHLERWSEAHHRWWFAPGPMEDRAAAYDEWEMEPTVFLASIGELRPHELEELERRAAEAAARIDTGAERSGSGGLDLCDRRAVKLWERVREALA